MSFYPELDSLSLEELKKRFAEDAPEVSDYAVIYYTEVATLIASTKEGITFLRNFIPKSNTDQLRAILFALANIKMNPEINQVFIEHLQHPDPLVISEAIDSLRRVESLAVKQQIIDLLQHNSPYVGGSVLRYMSAIYPDEAYPLLVESLKSTESIIRQNAADELGELHRPDAIPMLVPLLEDPQAEVKQAAETAIEMLKDGNNEDNQLRK